MIRHSHSGDNDFSRQLRRRQQLFSPFCVVFGTILFVLIGGSFWWLRIAALSHQAADAQGQPEQRGTASVISVTPVQSPRHSPSIGLPRITVSIDGKEADFRTMEVQIMPGDKTEVEYRIGKSGTLYVDRQLVGGQWVAVVLNGPF